MAKIEFWRVEQVRKPVGSIELRRAGRGYVSVRGPVRRLSEEQSREAARFCEPVPLLNEDSGQGPVGCHSVYDGEGLTWQGYPVRWLDVQEPLSGAMQARRRGAKGSAAPFAYVPRAVGLGAKGPILRYLPVVEDCARTWKVPVSLLLAVLQVESSGRETLVSPREAVGLMQVIPREAGLEVSRHLGQEPDADGEEAQQGLLRDVLFSPEVNICYGAGYLHLLRKNYFASVTDREARMLCVVTAYNLGPGRFLRLFAGEGKRPLERINSLTAQGLYEEILERVPGRNGYRYLDKVITLMRQYRSMGY